MINLQNILAFVASFITVIIATPFVIKLAIKIGATDKPNKRKVHQSIMPRLGGLAIFIGVFVGFFVSGLYSQRVVTISVGACLIIIIGILDDLYELSAKVEFAGQLVVACLIVSSGLKSDFLTIPFVVDRMDLGLFSYPLTVFW